jgi:hypothetical protein
MFWDITPCSALKVNGRFGETYHLHRFHVRFSLGLFFHPEDGGDMFLRNVGYFNGIHGVISQKIVLFITTAVRTSNQTE